MSRTCYVSGCGDPVAGYSHLCANHAKTKARHGHPLQTAIRVHELKPYENAVSRWLAERASPDALPILIDRLGAMEAEASVYTERAIHGRPYQRHKLQAAETVKRVVKVNNARDIIVRMLAMGYLNHFNPRRFQSDEAFRFQVARQFRRMADTSVGITWDHEAGKTRRIYRDASPRTFRALWGLILGTGLPQYGNQLGAAIEADRSRRLPDTIKVTKALLGTTAFHQHVATDNKETAE